MRELYNVIRRAFVFADGAVIDTLGLGLTPPPTPELGLASPPPAPEPVTPPPAVAPADDGHRTLADQERDLILQALSDANGNKSKAAELLGIDRKRLYRRLAKYGL